jgi:hypothetical protein
MPKRPNRISEVKRALRKHKEGSWVVEGTPNQDVVKNLGFDASRRIREKLDKTPGKVVYLELGCGESPDTIRRILKEFGPEIESERLEVHGSHIMPKSEERDFMIRNASLHENGARIHNATIPMLIKKGIKADVIQEHAGPATHSNEPVETVKQVKNGLLKEGGHYAFHVPTDKIDGNEKALERLGASRKHQFELANRLQNTYHLRN